MEIQSSNSIAKRQALSTKDELDEFGFSIVNDIYSEAEVLQILALIASKDSDRATFRKSEDLFAIRQFLKEVPEVKEIVFNDKLKNLITEVFGESFFVVKSIYFDKPEKSNWYVSYHQDLTISVDKKTELEGFGPWTTKQGQFAVQPPLAILQRNFTIRIHLDDTDENNGALKVIPQSHLKNIYRPETINWEVEKETICEVKKGGVMLMKPLTLHSSSRTTNGQKRRVIHIEFSDVDLPAGLQWSERLN
ncbi:MAG: phytanoyl-CoA dioxygenase family protein [Pedobacter sp.]|uniref:phytanoyl-CoA dioxygenase family protein n=1 Tax=Pedobacter sp. TaxID=1411316 RepID=UPI0028073103|nr:phytanoyl-CoA dioxygenase family protein [Pedobacter sp.]MDQ8005479.1 phytanoyl-CoA dioxygenase family protein [Pedobacter sp.]